ncbi:NAD(P)-binding protein [Sphingomonas corticis]|uniref:NAD(P)-binding protein n=1 Tax=Sphingomonas corticis TaxID=2722791 RepID=A0ABX1CRD3_9SPHN|nr:NAD(P)-binding protein [Sphingomonas corticis]NJR80034.1 NAD(P)-binding protein [Sphingomonas corticis]
MGETLKADYLVVGAGAMGMAFADTLVSETDATVVIVDRHHQPGGHWNVAYPFVRLHQPSAFYGVNSAPLGRDVIDATGSNAGLYELASSGEVVGYFGQIMQQHLLASGRVRYFPMAEHEGEGRFHSRISGETHQVEARKVVDATYMNVTVPAMRAPPYAVAHGVACITPNELVRLTRRPARFCVVGAGKTGMDACLFLLRNGVAPDGISWVMPRDSWLLDREGFQPAARFADRLAQGRMRQMAAVAAAESVDDLFQRLNEAGTLLRIDERVTPTMYRCATVSQAELADLRRITAIIRKGRVRRIEPAALELDGGTVPMEEDTLYIDCSADGLERRPAVPVFEDDLITLQSVRVCQQVFSAAFIAHVEHAYPDDALKNEICRPVPHPDGALDYLRVTLASTRNQMRWAQEPGLIEWLGNARLDWFGRNAAKLPDDPAARDAAMAKGREATALMIGKYERFLADAEAS